MGTLAISSAKGRCSSPQTGDGHAGTSVTDVQDDLLTPPCASPLKHRRSIRLTGDQFIARNGKAWR